MSVTPSRLPHLLLCVGGVLVFAATGLHAQNTKPLDVAPGQLVRQVVEHEVSDTRNAATKHFFISRKQTPKGSQTRLYAETNDAMAGMLIAIDDKPLTAQQQQAETDHLAWLEGNPDQLRKKHAREKEDAARTLQIVKALPDAFLYEYAGTETGTANLGKSGDPLVRLSFRPNPAYSPPSRVEQVLTGMKGFLIVDAAARRLARIDGTLFRDVSFGWGILGHLDSGGKFLVQQADIGDGDWELTQLTLKITGKILLFKSLSMVSDEVLSGYRRLPDNLSFADGVKLLKSESEKRTQASSSR
jgi:hypothetical protein